MSEEEGSSSSGSCSLCSLAAERRWWVGATARSSRCKGRGSLWSCSCSLLLLLFCRGWRCEQCSFDNLIHVFYQGDLDLLANFLWDLSEVFAVLHRDKNMAQVGLVSGQHFFA